MNLSKFFYLMALLFVFNSVSHGSNENISKENINPNKRKYVRTGNHSKEKSCIDPQAKYREKIQKAKKEYLILNGLKKLPKDFLTTEELSKLKNNTPQARNQASLQKCLELLKKDSRSTFYKGNKNLVIREEQDKINNIDSGEAKEEDPSDEEKPMQKKQKVKEASIFQIIDKN